MKKNIIVLHEINLHVSYIETTTKKVPFSMTSASASVSAPGVQVKKDKSKEDRVLVVFNKWLKLVEESGGTCTPVNPGDALTPYSTLRLTLPQNIFTQNTDLVNTLWHGIPWNVKEDDPTHITRDFEPRICKQDIKSKQVDEKKLPVKILSLSGIGSRGICTLYELILLEDIGINLLTDFDLIAGCSVGGWISSGLHAGLTCRQMFQVLFQVSDQVHTASAHAASTQGVGEGEGEGVLAGDSPSGLTTGEETILGDTALRNILEPLMAETLTSRIANLKEQAKLGDIARCMSFLTCIDTIPTTRTMVLAERRFPRTLEEEKESDNAKPGITKVDAMMANASVVVPVKIGPGAVPCLQGALTISSAISYSIEQSKKDYPDRKIGMIVEVGAWDSPICVVPQMDPWNLVIHAAIARLSDVETQVEMTLRCIDEPNRPRVFRFNPCLLGDDGLTWKFAKRMIVDTSQQLTTPDKLMALLEIGLLLVSIGGSDC